MQQPNGKRKTRKKGISRRDFMRSSAASGTVVVAGLAGINAAENPHARTLNTEPALQKSERTTQAREQAATSTVNRREILFAVGDTLIPSSPGDPGYRDLEWYGITEKVNRRLEALPDTALDQFNRSGISGLKRKFTELSDGQRAEYFKLLLQTGSFKDEALQKQLRDIYDQIREVVFTVYYQNFPEDHWPRDAKRVPLLRPGDEHQITNPSTAALVTGWDVTGYAGPLTWEEEERRRKYFKKLNWVDS